MARWSIHAWPGSGTGPSSQPSKRPPSREHSYSPGSFELKVKAALVLVVEGCLGPETMVVSGRLPSVVQLHSSGVVSRTPSGVLDRTSCMCSPSARPLISYGLEQAEKIPRSMAHSKVEPATVDEKMNLAGPLRISASGPTSIV